MGDGLAAPHAKEIKKKMAQKDAKGKTAERQPALTFALTILAPLQHLQPGGSGVFPTRRY
jgi:hypothetical protein